MRNRIRSAIRPVTSSAARSRCVRTLRSNSSSAVSNASAPLAFQIAPAGLSRSSRMAASASTVDTGKIFRKDDPASPRRRRNSFSRSPRSRRRSQCVTASNPRPRKRAGSCSHAARSLSFHAWVLKVHQTARSTVWEGKSAIEPSNLASARPGKNLNPAQPFRWQTDIKPKDILRRSLARGAQPLPAPVMVHGPNLRLRCMIE